MKIHALPFLLLLLALAVPSLSFGQNKAVPEELKRKISSGYQADKLVLNRNDQKASTELSNMSNLFLFSKKPKLQDVKEPTATDPVILPDWIANKKYVTQNVDALKYEPTLLVGGLVKLYANGSFDVYTVTWNVSDSNYSPELSQIQKPTNFYEQTFDSKTRFNSDFLIGGVSIADDEMVKATYIESNYVNLKKYDTEKLKNLRDYIKGIPGADLKDWAIIRGVVILDCTNSKSSKVTADANVKASWISANGSFYQQKGNTNNYRLISIDLENLFLVQ
ncbi:MULTISPECIES: hypothetical protein [Chryseobacterium]|uniref:Uncharacterized protein n=1 Tax=Candidatus Chryseobacterium massiliense TaxID=204089 RepID=A0A3D9BBF2_9FLAO|nr:MULTISPECIES: hypothetical protein [Chryseobacterium]REC50642.1 hypothetical protein DRF68_09100 [Candidatus Chryseobacterium massiliae]